MLLLWYLLGCALIVATIAIHVAWDVGGWDPIDWYRLAKREPRSRYFPDRK